MVREPEIRSPSGEFCARYRSARTPCSATWRLKGSALTRPRLMKPRAVPEPP